MHEKTNLLAVISIAGLVIALIVLATFNKPVVNVSSTGGIEQNTLSVSGNAELTVAPDKAEIYLGIVTEGATAKEVQDDNKILADKVIDALKRAGIKKDDIETSNYYLSKKTEWDPSLRKSVDKGYILTHTLKVTTDDIEKVGKLVDTAVSAGANQVQRISFGLSKKKEKEVRDEALKRAGEVAKDKAESVASSLNIRLGKIKSVQESNFYYAPFEYAPRPAGIEKAVIAEIETPISPQKVEVRSSINLVFEIN